MVSDPGNNKSSMYTDDIITLTTCKGSNVFNENLYPMTTFRSRFVCFGKCRTRVYGMRAETGERGL